MNKLYDSILDTVGNTPIVRLNKLGPDGVNVWVKVESFNPMSSVKDRLALSVIEAAEREGRLKPGQTVIEATSGNTARNHRRVHPRAVGAERGISADVAESGNPGSVDRPRDGSESLPRIEPLR